MVSTSPRAERTVPHSARTVRAANGAVPARGETRAWEHILTRAYDEGVSGLLHESLVGRNDVDVPDDALRRLAAERSRVAAANRDALNRLERVVLAFRRARIDLMALKGAALLLCLYEDAGLRPMCDVDLLIHPGDAERADRLLAELGYRRGKPLLRRDFYPRFYYEREYLGPGPRPLRLDMHVRPWRPQRCHATVPNGALWDARCRAPLNTTHVHIPDPADMLIHLACHAAFHGGTRLLWLLDIHRLITRHHSRLDWNTFMRRLEAWKLACAARYGLEQVERALGPCVPDQVRAALRAAPAAWRDRLALRQSPRDRASPAARTVVDLLCAPGWRFRLGYLRAVLLPDRTHMAQRYRPRHPGWIYCAHAVRVLLGLARAVRQRLPGTLTARPGNDGRPLARPMGRE